MPCRGSYSNTDFMSEIDQIGEICQKFATSYLIVAGDFNVDQGKSNDTRVKYLKKFLSANKLSEIFPIHTPTFRHHNGKHTSKIDYIFISENLRAAISTAEYKVLDHDPHNTSTHSPLILKLLLKDPMARKEIIEKRKWVGKPLWSRCDQSVYTENISKYLNTNVHPSSPDDAINYLTEVILKVTSECTPHTRQRPKSSPWNPTIAQCLRDSRAADADWKRANNPPPPHTLYTRRREAQRNFRSAQRIQAAISRNRNLEILHSASADNSKLFFSIIRKQRGNTSSNTKELFYNGKLYTDDLLPIWREHFATLATPSTDPNFNIDSLNMATEDVANLSKLCETSTLPPIPITKAEVARAIQSLKKKKASDGSGLSAEHLQMAIDPITSFLTPIINEVLATSYYPITVKEGIMHPVHKKGKKISIPGNHRGITVSPLIGKVLDSISLRHQQSATPSRLHKLQFGFTPEKSGTHAAFLLNEALAEAKDTKLPLYVATLDVQKAFDVVKHESLLCKLFQQGLVGRWFKLKQDSYRNLTAKVKWEGKTSEPFAILQGNGQGKLPSPDDYLSYLVQNLINLAKSLLGFSIGTTDIATPTCADDMLVLASNMYELQALLEIIVDYANKEHYIIHPDKSMIIPFNLSSSSQKEFLLANKPWSINGNDLPVNEEMVHVGVQRDLKGADPTIQHRTSLGRRTLFALMGAGMVGKNGLPVMTCLHIYEIYVLPRVTYGLECLRISKTNFKTLELFQRSILRPLLDLPDRVAIPSLYILTGAMPMDAIIHQKALAFLHALVKTEGPTRDIILRQYAIKGKTSKSWVIYVKELLQTYSLPTILELLQDFPSKSHWKKQVKNAILEKITEDIEDEATTKSTLRYLNHKYSYNTGHLAVTEVRSPREVRRAGIKLRLLTGTYTLQSSQLTFGKVTTDQCLMCQSAGEDTKHFLLECAYLNDSRRPYLIQIDTLIPHVYMHRYTVFNNNCLLVQLLLDPGHPSIIQYIDLPKQYRIELETISRNMCFKLHTVRALYMLKRINK